MTLLYFSIVSLGEKMTYHFLFTIFFSAGHGKGKGRGRKNTCVCVGSGAGTKYCGGGVGEG